MQWLLTKVPIWDASNLLSQQFDEDNDRHGARTAVSTETRLCAGHLGFNSQQEE
jgi:hypothetical protein